MSEYERLSMALLLILIPFLLIVLVISLLTVVGRWKLFKKAGKNGWEAIIPFYSDYVYVEISGLNWWYFLLIISNTLLAFVSESLQMFAYPLSLIALFFCNYNISKKLHKDTLFAVLMTLFPFIMLLVIAFGKNYNWDNTVKVGPNGPINENNNSQGQNNNSSNVSYTYDANNASTDSMSNDDNNNNTDSMNNIDNNFTNDSGAVNFCPGCGSKLEKNIKYCPNCGKEI